MPTFSFRNGDNYTGSLVQYAGAEDVDLQQSNPDINFSSGSDIVWDSSPVRWALIRFNDIFGNEIDGKIPQGAIIVSAYIRGYYFDTQGTPTDPGTAHLALHDWLENTVTWNSFSSSENINEPPIPNIDYDPSIISYLPVVNPAAFADFDVTTAIQRWSNLEPNYGLVLIPHSTSGTGPRSSEHVTQSERIQLVVSFIEQSSSSSKSSSKMPDVEVIHYVKAPYDNINNKCSQNVSTRIQTEIAGALQPSGVKWDYTNNKLYYHGDGQSNQVASLSGPPWIKTALSYTSLNFIDLEDCTWVNDGGNLWFISEDQQSIYEIKNPGSTANTIRTINLPAHTGAFESFEWIPTGNAPYGGYFIGGIQNYNLAYIYEVDVNNFSSTTIIEKLNLSPGGGGYDNSGMDYDREARVLYVHHGGNNINHVILLDSLSIGGQRPPNGFRGKIIDTFGHTIANCEGFTLDKINRRCFFAEDNAGSAGYIHMCPFNPHGTIDPSGMFPGGTNHIVKAYPDNGYRVKEWRILVSGASNWDIIPATDNSLVIPNLLLDTIVMVEFEEVTHSSSSHSSSSHSSSSHSSSSHSSSSHSSSSHSSSSHSSSSHSSSSHSSSSHSSSSHSSSSHSSSSHSSSSHSSSSHSSSSHSSSSHSSSSHSSSRSSSSRSSSSRSSSSRSSSSSTKRRKKWWWLR